MPDVANLVLGIDSRPVEAFRENLRALPGAAQAAETATTSLGQAAAAAGGGLTTLGSAAGGAATAVSQAAQQAAAAGASFATAGTQAQAAGSGFASMAAQVTASQAAVQRASVATGSLGSTIGLSSAAIGTFTPQATALGAAAANLGQQATLAASGFMSMGASAAASMGALGAIGPRTQAAGQQAATGAKLASHELANLSFQLQDIAVMAASGQSFGPLVMQQGMQIAGIFQNSAVAAQGLRGVMTALGSGIMSMLTNPLNLAVLAIAGAGAAVQALWRNWDSGAGNAEDDIKTFDALFQRLRASAEGTANEIAKVGDESRRVLEFQTATSAAALRSEIAAGAGDLQSQIPSPMAVMAQVRNRPGAANPAEFAAVNRELSQFISLAQDGGSGALALRERLVELATAPGVTQGFRDRVALIIAQTDALAALELRASAAESAMARAATAPAIGSFRGAQEGEGAGRGRLAREEQLRTDNEMRRHAAAMAALQAVSPLEQERLAVLRATNDALRDGEGISRSEQAAIANAGIEARVRAERELADAIRERANAEVEAQATGQRNLVLDLQFEREQAGRTAQERAIAARLRQLDTPSQRFMDTPAGQQSAAAMRETQQIEAMTDAYRDLQFAREQMGRTRAEQQIASDLRRMGIEAESAYGRLYAAQARVNERMQFLNTTGRQALGEFFDGVKQGEGVFRSLGDAAESVADRLQERFLDAAWAQMFGGAQQNAAANPGGLLGRLFGMPTDGGGGALPGLPGGAPVPVTIVGGLPGLPTAPGLLGAISGAGGGAASGNPMLDLIARAEGTAGRPGGGYNTSLGYGAYLPGGAEQNLSGMTLNQIDALQRGMLNNPANPFNSSALGRYQITRRTRIGLQQQMGLTGDELYDADMQDRMGLQLLANRRGQGVTGLRNEWQGLNRVGSSEIDAAMAQQAAALRSASSQMTASASEFAPQFDSGLQSVAQSVATSATSFGGSFQSALQSVVNSMMSGGGGGGGLMLSTVQALANSGGAGLFAGGGQVRGPGFGRSDSVPAGRGIRVSDGEYVMPADMTARNLDILDQMRAGYDVRGPRPTPQQWGGGSGSTQVNIQVANPIPGTKATVREESDGRGGRNIKIVMAEEYADAAMSSQGRRAQRAYGNTPPTTTR